MGIVNLVFNYRSLFGASVAATAFGLVKSSIDLRPQLRKKLTPILFTVLVGGGAIFAQGLVAVYALSCRKRFVGSGSTGQIRNSELRGSQPVAVGPQQIFGVDSGHFHSPILGHGSWARDVTYIFMLRDIMESKGFDTKSFVIEGDLIPSHSHLLGSWVEAGVMGGVFWMAVEALAVVALYRTLKLRDAPASLLAFVFFSLMWDVLFSPFGASQRFIKPLQIGCALWVLNRPSEQRTSNLETQLRNRAV